MAKKINHRGHGGYRELLFSVSSVLSVVFPKPVSEDNKKSLKLQFNKGFSRLKDRNSVPEDSDPTLHRPVQFP